MKIATASNYDLILHAVYEGVSDSTRWVDAMRLMQELVGSCQATYLTTSRRTGAVGIEELARSDASLQSAYLADFISLDPIRERLLAHGMAKGQWLNDEHFLGAHGRQRHPFYQELLRPHGLGAMLSIPLYDDGDVIGALTFQAEAAGAPFDASHQELLAPLVHHLLIAASLRERFKRLSNRVRLDEAVLDRLAAPLLIVDRNGRILYANRRAERWQASRSSPLFEQHGTAGRHALGRLMRELAARLCAPNGLQTMAFESAIVDQATGTSLIGFPLPADNAASFGMQEPVCLLLVCVHPFQAEEFAADIIADLFGLTRAEHRLVGALSRSTNVVRAAKELGIKHATARTQLACVFQKTGCATQAELARLMAGISQFEPAAG